MADSTLSSIFAILWILSVIGLVLVLVKPDIALFWNKDKKDKKKGLIVYGIAFIVTLLLTGALAPPSETPTTLPTATPAPTSNQPTTAPTAKPTATPKPTAALTGYDLYSTWDKDKIQAEATAVDWNDFIRYPDNYEGKLIHLRGDIVFDNKDFGGSAYFTVNVNPTFFKNHQYSNSDDYTPQYVQFNYNTQGLIDGDEIEMYGVYNGETTFTDYPEIDGVYCIHYTFK